MTWSTASKRSTLAARAARHDGVETSRSELRSPASRYCSGRWSRECQVRYSASRPPGSRADREINARRMSVEPVASTSGSSSVGVPARSIFTNYIESLATSILIFGAGCIHVDDSRGSLNRGRTCRPHARSRENRSSSRTSRWQHTRIRRSDLDPGCTSCQSAIWYVGHGGRTSAQVPLTLKRYALADLIGCPRVIGRGTDSRWLSCARPKETIDVNIR
jgi:hypothetical protein